MTLEELKQYRTDPPEFWGAFGTQEDFAGIPEVHKDQIVFLSPEGESFLMAFLNSSRMFYPPHSAEDDETHEQSDWPFRYKYFRSIEKLRGIPEDKKLKKWLFNRGLSFKTEVYVIPHSGPAFITSWKIIVKYSPLLFWGEDVYIFDKTLNWALFYFHHDTFFFGKDNINSGELDEKSMEQINMMKRQFPNAYFPY